MEKPWLASYPTGVSPTIDTSLCSDVAALMDDTFANQGDKVALIHMGNTLTFAQVDAHANAFAAYLRQVVGLDKGDRMAVMMPNCSQYPIAVLGALRAGVVIVNTNPLYTPHELDHQLKDSGARAILIMDLFAHTLEKVLQTQSVEHVLITSLGDMMKFPKRHLVNAVVRYVKKMVPKYHLPTAKRFNTALAEGAAHSFVREVLSHDDIAFLQYTGGTTGVAKGAMLTHGNMVANVLQAEAWIAPAGMSSDTDDCVVTALPLYHIFALTANLLTFTRLGVRTLLITNPRDMPGFIKELKNNRFTIFTGVNTLFNGLLNTPGFSELPFKDFKLALGGGMAVQRSVAERWESVTGKPLLEAYGLTETSPAASINPVDLEAYNGSIGLPISSTEMCVRDEQGNTLAIGERGELCIRGPQVMKGYWQRPEETAQVLDAEGWLRTGDVAQMDEKGFVYIVDRLKDMVLVSGFNVYPNEIEGVAASHEKVIEVGVIGVPDKQSGEAVKLIAVRSDDSLSEKELIDFCRESLTAYKIPRYVQFVDELPMTNVGKILRRELRDLYGGEQQ